MNPRIESIPLKVLICDPDDSSARILEQALSDASQVLSVIVEPSIQSASTILREGQINTVFIDPLTHDLEISSRFVFEVRKTLPEVVFVLYVDTEAIEIRRSEFYRGERRRFSHYYTMDKRTPISSLADELASVITRCQSDLSWRMSRESLERLFEDARRRRISPNDPRMGILTQLQGVMSRLMDSAPEGQRVQKNAVFLSHRFAESEYVTGLSNLLEQSGFVPVTGKSASTYISKAVLDRIRDCEFFLCLLTKHEQKADGTYTTSSWLLQETGAALAFRKQIVLMVEEGVTDIGGLQGDWQRTHFGTKGFLKAALEAVEQLRSYAGQG